MAKKKGKSKVNPIPARTIGSEGLDHLTAGRFKLAIESLKSALKEDPHATILRERLVEAYEGRADELSSKGMAREAAVMLEKSGAITGTPPDPVRLCALYLKGGQLARALDSLAPLKATPEGRNVLSTGPLAELLAVSALVGQVENVAPLLDDESSSFMKHLQTARELLNACADGRDEEALGLLKKLPITSPFKNVRVFIHALILSSPQPQKSLKLIDKIEDTSLFHPMAQAVRLSVTGGPSVLQSISSLDPPARDLATRLLNVSPEAFQAIRQLEQGAPDQRIKGLLARSLENYFPRATLRTLCLVLLPHAPGYLGLFQQRFGPLPPWEVHRIRALDLEHRDRWEGAVVEWIKAVEHMDDPMMKALVFRHLAGFKTYEDLDDIPRILFRSKGRNDYSRAKFLESSLDHDPDDRETHLALMGLHDSKRDAKSVRAVIDRAVRAFPGDRDILEAAMDAAFASGTFKKAVSFAEKILVVNPIHSRAREILVEAHLAHARKKVKEKRLDLADKELVVAESTEKESTRNGRVQVCQAMLALLRGEEKQAEEQLDRVRNLKKNSLEVELMIQSEAERFHVPATLMKKIINNNFKQVVDRMTPDAISFPALIRELDRYRQDKHLPMQKWYKTLLPVFTRAVHVEISLEERRSVCNFLLENELFNPLEQFAGEGLRQWGDEPSFRFFNMVAKARGNAFRADRWALRRLERDMTSLQARLDTRTMGNMERFLSMVGGTPFGAYAGDGPDDDDTGEEAADEELFESVVGPVLEVLSEEVRSRVRAEGALRRKLGDKKYEEKLVKELSRGPLDNEMFREVIRRIVQEILSGGGEP